MKLSPKINSGISKIGKSLQLEFIRAFGSYVRNSKSARDLDIVFGNRDLNLDELSYLQSELSKLFRIEVDLVRLTPGLSGGLIREIASTSESLWEKPKSGARSYIDMIDRLLSVAEDERLSMTADLRAYNKKIRRERL